MSGSVTRLLRSLTKEKGSATAEFERLVSIIAKLRDPEGGCPWDLEQTHRSLKPYVIEEAHEVVEAIDHSPTHLRDELGDLLLQVVLHAQIASEEGTFSIRDVLSAVSDKMIRRHPHVFGTTSVQGSSEVLENWETIKQRELPRESSILDGVPRSMPGLLRAQRTGDKAARVGFDWIRSEEVLAKVEEELREFIEAARGTPHKPTPELAEEFGDLLFSLAQFARKLKLNSEEILGEATAKFTRRFKALERLARERFPGRPLKELSAHDLDGLWHSVKLLERGSSEIGEDLVAPSVPTSFEFLAPAAQHVEVTGSFCGWKIGSYPLTRDTAGKWHITIPLAPGRHEYRYLVDGVWLNDQRPVECVATSYGSWNCVIDVAESRP